MKFYVEIKRRSLIKVNNMISAHQMGVPVRARVPDCVSMWVGVRESINYKCLVKIRDFVVAFYAMPSSLCSFVCTDIWKTDDVTVVESQADVCPGR